MEVIRMEENVIFNTEDVEQNKVFGILSYIGILVLVPILAAKDSQYARFHANQGLVLLITDVIIGACMRILSTVLGIIPFLGSLVAGLISAPFVILLLVLMILGIVNACSGEPKKLPVIGQITIIK